MFYYLKELDLKRFGLFLNHASSVTGKSMVKLIADDVYSVFKFNTSLIDYFCFRFYEMKNFERSAWAGTGFMYEYQLMMNPKKVRWVLEDKAAFNDKFNSLINREYFQLEKTKKNPEIIKRLLENSDGRIVLKNSLGQAGKQIKIIISSEFTQDQLINVMKSGNFDLAEEYIIQHPEMMKLSPSGLNTVRVITQEKDGKIAIIAARLRISINSLVDNLAAGNAAAPLDPVTGIVTGPAVFSDITRTDIFFHPITGVEIPGFQVPFWKEVVALVIKAAMMTPDNRSIGWDVGIKASGPLLVEGNHNWCKLLWQLPVKKGLKKELEIYL